MTLSHEACWAGVAVMCVKGSAVCFQAEDFFFLCCHRCICQPPFLSGGLPFNLFLIAYLTHLAIKVKWLFDKCERYLISANWFG